MQFEYNGKPVLAVSPQDFEFTLKYPCSVTPCVEGEYRRSLSDIPGVSVSLNGIAYSQDYAFALSEAMVMGNFDLTTGNREQELYVPFWADIGDKASPTTATTPTGNTRFTAGQPVLVWGSEFEHSVVTVQSVFGSTLTLDSQPNHDWYHVTPLILMNFQDFSIENRGLSPRYKFSGVESSPSSSWIFEGNSSLLDAFFVDSRVRYKSDNKTNYFSTGTSSQTSQWRLRNQNKRNIQVSVEVDTRAAYDNMLSTLAYMRGRYRSHDLATNRRDLQPTVNFVGGSMIIVRKSHEDLSLYLGRYKISSGVGFYQNMIQVDSVVDLGADVQLNLLSPLPQPVDTNTIVSKTRDYRFASDEFT